MKYLISFSLVLVGGIGAHAMVAEAQELYWGSIEHIREDRVQILYSSPDEDVRVACSLNTYDCDPIDEDEEIIPEGAKHLSRNTLNDWGVQLLPGEQSLLVYRIHEDKVELSDTLAFPDKVITTRFARAANVLVILRHNVVDVYDLADKTKKTIPYVADVVRNPLVSSDGSHFSFFTRLGTLGMYALMNLETGTLRYIPANTMDFLEVSADGRYVAFIDRGEEETRLMIGDASGATIIPSVAFETENEIFDHVFLGHDLFFTTNDDEQYNWRLYRFNGGSKKLDVVDDEISYADYMKIAGDKLLYHKVNENVSEIKVYDPERDETARLEGVEPELLDRNITRKTLRIAGFDAVLLEHDDSRSRDRLPLVLWLHGGPERQTSVGYHPYLSYAVYDEMLEKIADSGAARVLKIDYPGSWGYGRKFREVLQGQIGVADTEGIEKALKEFTKDYRTSEVHPIGVSYGGYLSLKLLAENPEAYDSATAINAVTDWRSLITRIPGSVFTPRFNGVPSFINEREYAAADIYNKLSDISARIPILVAYGERDTTVPPWQSTDFIMRADEEDLDVEVVSFEEEAHVLRERRNLVELCEEVVEVMRFRRVDCD